MPVTIMTDDRMAIGETVSAGPGSLRRLQAASPLLVGLLVPLVIVYMLDPAMLRHARFVITLLLVAVMVVAAALYIASVLTSGDVRSVILDVRNRVVELVMDGAFATSNLKVPFDEIATVKRIRVGGREGYGESRMLIELRNKQLIELPEDMTDADIATMLSALGRTGKATA